VRGAANDVVILLYSMDPGAVRAFLDKCTTVRAAIMKELNDGFKELDGEEAQPQVLSSKLAVASAAPANTAAAAAAATTATATTRAPKHEHSHAASSCAAADPSEVEALEVHSERDLMAHLEQISRALANTEYDFWEERRDAMLTLQKLILGGAHVGYKKIFFKAVMGLPIGAQIEDLRSQVRASSRMAQQQTLLHLLTLAHTVFGAR